MYLCALIAKSLSYLLNIETATTVCSVSLSRDEEILFCKELNEGFTHAENLHLFIEEALKETGLQASQLNAIAVSKGPGSYTGLRIGVSTAKGLAYALGIPLISVDTLQVMSLAAANSLREEPDFYCPMIDARRMEVYMGIYDRHFTPLIPIEALIVDENSKLKFDTYTGTLCFFGDGMEKCKSLLNTNQRSIFPENIMPSARFMPYFSSQKFKAREFEDLAYFEPFYLKDFLIVKKKAKS